MIAYAYGAELEFLPAKERGITDIGVTKEDKLFREIKHFCVFQNHRWVVKKPGILTSLAQSKDGIDVVKHPDLFQYGVQFHPEQFSNFTFGRGIFENFIAGIAEMHCVIK